MDPRDLAMMGAGVLGAGVALVHGVLTRRFITRPIREIAGGRLRPQILRLFVMLLDFSTFSWFVGGVALAAAPWMSPQARGITALLVGGAYLYAVLGNAWATRGRHPGWMLYAVCLVLIAYGARAPAAPVMDGEAPASPPATAPAGSAAGQAR